MKSCLFAKCKHCFILEFLETLLITVNNDRDVVDLWMIMIALTEYLNGLLKDVQGGLLPVLGP